MSEEIRELRIKFAKDRNTHGLELVENIYQPLVANCHPDHLSYDQQIEDAMLWLGSGERFCVTRNA
jgi:hypothetical protein